MKTKRLFVLLLSFSLLLSIVIQSYAVSESDNNHMTDQVSNVEFIDVNGQHLKYVTYENDIYRKINIFDSKNHILNTVKYNKLENSLFVDDQPLEFEAEEENIIEPQLLSTGLLVSGWKNTNTQKFRYSIKQTIAVSVALAAIAGLAGGPVGAFAGAASVWNAAKANCSGIVKWYYKQIGHRTQSKGVCDLYWGRNWEEYFYSTTWLSTPH